MVTSPGWKTATEYPVGGGRRAVYIEFNAFIWAARSPKAPHVNLTLLHSWCLEGMGHIKTRGEATFAGRGVG